MTQHPNPPVQDTPRQPPGYLILTADFPPTEGGISTLTRQLAEGLSRRGRLAAVGAPRIRGKTPGGFEYPYPVFRIPGYAWGPLRALPARRAVDQWVRQHRDRLCKIIALNVGFGGWLGKWGRQRWALPFDTFAYGFEFLKYRRNPVLRRFLLGIYKAADRVLSISEFTTQELVRFGVPPGRITRVPLGVDTERFRPDLDASELRRRLGADRERVLLSVGRLIPRKGQHLVIHALPRLIQEHPNIVYWVVGRGPQRPHLEALAKRLGIERHVRFFEDVTDVELPRFYAACDLFVLPTSQVGGSVEGYGLVFLEAAACGKPAVAGRSGGVPEAVIDGQTGILVDPSHPDALAAALGDLLQHPEQLQALGAAARKRAEKMSFQRTLELF